MDAFPECPSPLHHTHQTFDPKHAHAPPTRSMPTHAHRYPESALDHYAECGWFFRQKHAQGTWQITCVAQLRRKSTTNPSVGGSGEVLARPHVCEVTIWQKRPRQTPTPQAATRP